MKIIGFLKKITLMALCACMITGYAEAATLSDGQEIKLWPGKAPGSENVTFHNKVIERSKDPTVHDRAMVTIDVPHMVARVPKNPNGTAVIICPGGGYARVVIDKEGDEVARWLNEIGVTAFILRYRLPQDAHVNREDVSLEDGQRAIRIIRAHAKEWGLNADKIGVMGFSAGGHAASFLSTCYGRDVYKPVDDMDKLFARPDFTVLGYPVISMLDQYAHEGTKKRMLGKTPTKEQMEKYSTELYINKNTPPAFIFCAENDDVVPPVNSVRYFENLRSCGVPSELHVYTDGKHGFGIGSQLKTSAKYWSKACEAWLRDMEFIN